MYAEASGIFRSVAGIFKEVATIFLSTVVFHDQLTPINISGLCVALMGKRILLIKKVSTSAADVLTLALQPDV